MNIIDLISTYSARKKEVERIEKEKLSVRADELANQICQLKPRIDELIATANACIRNNIEIDQYHRRGYRSEDCYERGTFVTNSISHRVGFVVNRDGLYELGINAGGACGSWDFRTNGSYVRSVLETNRNTRRAPLIEHMEAFLSQFDVFEKAFYAYVDDIVGKE